VLVKPFLADPT